ncbi:hypothetical protein [Terribacillus saccharophilus]|uniref:hypothetical protein n=1 Tax=Terribacillus saccharophilus TaxID=361277 RepID=UPI00298A0154|nr:hypothetical protein [Terribacillus saccharophilus]MCM3227528.1 hypothetical protein [Terribacillus saccharophilus]
MEDSLILLAALRRNHEISLTTVNEKWVFRLYEKATCPKDFGESFVFHTEGEILHEVVQEAFYWSKERYNYFIDNLILAKYI